jgi:integrase
LNIHPGLLHASRLRETAPTSVNVTVGMRSREYLTDREIERLIEATKQNRSGHRDATAILVAYRHGLRASELVALRWDDIDLATGRLHVRRAKSGDASVHPISARESRALRKLLREAPSAHRNSIATFFPSSYPKLPSPWRNAATGAVRAADERLLRKPITGSCCARAARGHVTTEPATTLMKSRRCIAALPDIV